jgi:60 kDa SS-A/Ro ribonucleoprotein
MMNYLKIFTRKAEAITPQSLPIERSVANSAGGYAFPVDDWARLDRFLILGAEGGSYYAAERVLTRDNAQAVLRAIAADGERAVARIVAVSVAGRAPKNDPALFALALAASASDLPTRRAALAALPRVARTGTHLFQFAELVEGSRGWGRALRRAVGAWYLAQPAEKLAYQLVKYRQRGGWSHRDLLRLAHPETTDPVRIALFDWVCRATVGEALPAFVRAAIALGATGSGAEAAALIRAHDLPREAVPTALLNDAAVWEALLERMPMTALVRSLAKVTDLGVIRPLGDHLPLVLSAFADADRIARARLHPLAILLALRTYAQGHGDRGKLLWRPVQAVVDALNAAFYTAFRSVEPTGKRLLLALDVSGSMGSGRVAGTSLTPREASAAMALMTAATEANTHIVAFAAGEDGRYGGRWGGSARMAPVGLSPSMRLDDAVRAVSNLPFGGTDCALPMLHALERGLQVDAFVVYTDSETWAGEIHPVQALRQYRERTGIAAKLVVVGLVSNGFSIADPDDAGMLDVVGFDAAAPAVIADFIR